MMRRCDETPTEGGETLAVRPQRGRQTARQSSEAQLATVAPLLRWLMSHPAAWAMGRMAARAVRASRQSPPRAGIAKRAAVALSRRRPSWAMGRPCRVMAHAVAVTRQRQLTPTAGEEETLARDGPRSSRHASEERRILGTPLKHGEASTCDSPQKDSGYPTEHGEASTCENLRFSGCWNEYTGGTECATGTLRGATGSSQQGSCRNEGTQR